MDQSELQDGLRSAADLSAERPARAESSETGRARGAEIAIKGLFVLALFYALTLASAIVLPLLLAILLTLILSPAVRALTRLRLPEPVGAAVVVAGLVAGLAFSVYLLAGPATDWIERAPNTLGQVERKVRGIKKSVKDISQAAKKVDEITNVEAEGPAAAPPPAPRASLLSRILTGTQSVMVSAVSTAVLLYFLLASGDMFLRKLVRVMPTLTDKKRAVEVARAIQSDMGRYLLTISCINAALGVVTGLAMYLLGMPNPILWGALAAVLNFVPYLGAAVTLAILTIVAFLTFDAPGQIAVVPFVFLVLTTLEGQLLTPLLTGRRLTLNPVVIFLSMLVWTWLWGAIGALLAVPILMTFKILCDHIESLAPVGEFLSGKQVEPNS
jgi:predicted PurR-regulated permease PerM